MGNIKDYPWVFPLIGGIIALIAFISPAGYYSDYYGYMDFWMWGLISLNLYGYGSVTAFTEDPGEIIISAICSLLVLISIILIISKAYKTRKYSYVSTWLAPSILMMIGTIGWIVGMELNGRIFYDVSLWSVISPGFGVIGMFLGGILSIVGHVISKTSPKQPREVIVPMKEQFMRPTADQSNDLAVELGTRTVKFCPMCGDKLIKINQKFCSSCGFNFMNISQDPTNKQVIKPLTIPPDIEEDSFIKEDCPNCEMSRKLKRQECIWCGKSL
ncbi:MAG: hypothetical protein ACFFA4_04245 [Promethearchaeota archaeon]